MSAKEFEEWQEYYQIEPFHQDRSEVQNAMFMRMYANTHRSENVSAYKLEDFMLTAEKKKKTLAEQIVETMSKFE